MNIAVAYLHIFTLIWFWYNRSANMMRRKLPTFGAASICLVCSQHFLFLSRWMQTYSCIRQESGKRHTYINKYMCTYGFLHVYSRSADSKQLMSWCLKTVLTECSNTWQTWFFCVKFTLNHFNFFLLKNLIIYRVERSLKIRK